MMTKLKYHCKYCKHALFFHRKADLFFELGVAGNCSHKGCKCEKYVEPRSVSSKRLKVK